MMYLQLKTFKRKCIIICKTYRMIFFLFIKKSSVGIHDSILNQVDACHQKLYRISSILNISYKNTFYEI